MLKWTKSPLLSLKRLLLKAGKDGKRTRLVQRFPLVHRCLVVLDWVNFKMGATHVLENTLCLSSLSPTFAIVSWLSFIDLNMTQGFCLVTPVFVPHQNRHAANYIWLWCCVPTSNMERIGVDVGALSMPSARYPGAASFVIQFIRQEGLGLAGPVSLFLFLKDRNVHSSDSYSLYFSCISSAI